MKEVGSSMPSIGNIIKTNCCGCGACENACLERSISLQADSEGFLYPNVDGQKCIGCGTCQKVCPVFNQSVKIDRFKQPIVFTGWNKDPTIRELSSSGGVFSVLAEQILMEKGVVFGAEFDDDFRVRHKAVNDVAEINLLRGSKYVQSTIGDSLKKVSEYLNKGKLVLFSGTPCQIAGLNSYLRKDYSNLYTCDLVCHGVPSPKVFQKYLNYLERYVGNKLVEFNFRSKLTGWKNYSICARFANGRELIYSRKKDSFINGFLKNIFLRPSCYNCGYNTIPRHGDITIGDFWGIGLKKPELDDDKGASLILINTEKGRQIFEKCSHKLFYFECQIEEAISGNPCLVKPVIQPSEREIFFKDLDHLSFDRVIKKYMRGPSKLQKKLKRIAKNFKFIIDMFK
jgi:coenzyme F420-reducing hydrogenase beta subunit